MGCDHFKRLHFDKYLRIDDLPEDRTLCWIKPQRIGATIDEIEEFSNDALTPHRASEIAGAMYETIIELEKMIPAGTC